MSIAAIDAVWKRSKAPTPLALLVMLALADWADDDGYCWPSLSAIQRKARCSRQGAVDTLKVLIGLGEMVKDDAAAGPVRYGRLGVRTNLYRITLVNAVDQSAQLTSQVQTAQVVNSAAQLVNSELMHIRNEPSLEPSKETSGRRAGDIYAKDVELLNTHAASIFALYREGWERTYKQPPSLISSPLDNMKIETHLKVLGLDAMSRALTGFFARRDDRTLRVRRHPLGLFLVNPSQYLVDELVHVDVAHTADEQRKQTRQGNVGAVADGRLARRLAGDES